MRVIQRSEQASSVIETNLVSAVKASLLLLPERFNAEELYTTVAGLSYTGELKKIRGVVNVANTNAFH